LSSSAENNIASKLYSQSRHFEIGNYTYEDSIFPGIVEGFKDERKIVKCSLQFQDLF